MPQQIEQENASEEVTQKFREILKSNGIFEEVKSVVITEPPELVGEHLATATVYARIEFKDEKLPVKNLFVKKFTNSEAFTAMMKEMRIMEKESTFYNTFLPEARKFCSKFKGCEDLLHFFPKVLYGDDEMLVLENLVLDDSFIMISKEDKQDLFTAKYVLENLAKFHASTFAYMEDMGRKEFRAKWELICLESLGPNNPILLAMTKNGITACINILKGNPVEGDEETVEALKGFLDVAYPTILEKVKFDPTNEKILCINHGDCWNNNMLFKKDPETGKVNDHVFVDLQITRLGSPNLDLGYFLYTSVKPIVRRTHLKELLQHYYDTFAQTLTSLNRKINMTFDEFFEDYKHKSQMGFFFGLCIIAAVGAIKDINVDTMGDNPNQLNEMFKTAIGNWIKANPDQAKEMSTEIVALVREYKSLLH